MGSLFSTSADIPAVSDTMDDSDVDDIESAPLSRDGIFEVEARGAPPTAQGPNSPSIPTQEQLLCSALKKYLQCRARHLDPLLCFADLNYALFFIQSPFTTYSASIPYFEHLLDLLLHICNGPHDLRDYSTLDDNCKSLIDLLSMMGQFTEFVIDQPVILAFMQELRIAWRLYKSIWSPERTRWSPMPWSAQSLKEGIPPPHDSLLTQFVPWGHFMSRVNPTQDGQGAHIVREDLFYFPDMLWLGGCHDGHSQILATTLSAYTWLRIPAVRTTVQELALWQCALSFGVLEAITGVKIPEDALLSPGPEGTLVLTSARVSTFIHSWLYTPQLPTSPAPDVSSAADLTSHIEPTLEWALRAIAEWQDSRFHINQLLLSDFRDTGTTPGEYENLLTNIRYSLATLSLSLLPLVTPALNTRRPSPFNWVSSVISTWIYEHSDTLSIARGWCPSSVRSSRLSPRGIAYTTALSPLVRADHKMCTPYRCIHHIVDVSKYKARHVPVCLNSSCLLLSPSFARISALLSAETIPVLVFDGHTLTVHRQAADRPYVAISHVWIDGLGSTTDVGLPICQIKRISSLASQLVKGGAFWVDSLCIPGDDHSELRKLAIRMMARTYRDAAKVLVFDAEIRQLSVSSTPLNEIMVRIARSSWMRRVWTLQEALLAHELYFEFADGLFDFARIAKACDSAIQIVPSWLGNIYRDAYLLQHVPDCLYLFMVSYHLHQRGESLRPFEFDLVVPPLNNRTTSKPADETLAIAGLLGVDISKLLAADDADARMKIFLLEMKILPAHILFNYAPRKLRFPGFRWAPCSFHFTPAISTALSGKAECTPHGLTTEEHLTVLRFSSDLAVDQLGTRPNHILMHFNSLATYGIVPAKHEQATSTAGQVMNAVVLPRVSAEVLVTQKDLSGIAVKTIPSDSSLSVISDSDGGAVVCEYLFDIDLVRLYPDFREATGDRGCIAEVEVNMTSACIIMT